MKKIFLGVGILALMGLSACEEKNETVISPEAENGTLTFELHTPQDAETVYTLLEEEQDKVVETLSYEKPDYGFSSATPTYSIEVSLEPDFKTKQLLKSVSQTQSIDLIAKELNGAILNLHAAGEYPALTEAQDVFVRMAAVISPVVKPAYSSAITMSVIPYEIQNIALPATYYLIGLGGEWGNDSVNIGTQLIPMSLVKDYAYDKTTGQGEFVYTGYFKTTDGFKLIGKPGDWKKNFWGMTDGNLTYEAGGDISVPANGYYRITLNSLTNTIAIDPIEFAPKAIKWIEMVGDFEGWGTTPARMTEKAGTEGGVWIGELVLDADGGMKFRADGSWDVASWGGKSFPYGLQPSGDNIPAVAGTYNVVFNVFDECYFFFKK